MASTSPCVSPKPVLAAKPVLSAYVHSSVTGAQPSMTAAPVGQPVQPAPTQHLHLHPEQGRTIFVLFPTVFYVITDRIVSCIVV